jgi:para-nitrobenzyl esterase
VANKVPTIIGSNKNEGTIFFALGTTIADDMQYLALVEQFFPGKGATIVAQYPSASFASPKDAAAEVIGDGWFVCPTRKTARGLSQAGVSTYVYHFTPPINSSFLSNAGTFHSSEIPFIFGNPFLGITLGPAEQDLSRAMIGYWSRMAATGDPNGDGGFAWPKYDATADSHMVLDLTLSTGTDLKKDVCDFWDGLSP